MTGARFLVAKYVPDLGRLEPHNIGVVAWTPGAVEARFLAERADRPGLVDRRSIPPYVTSPDAYQQWVFFWRAELARDEVEPIGGGASVALDSPDYLDALARSGRGHFLLADGGFVPDPVGAEELPTLTDYLFEMLVSAGMPKRPRNFQLDERCRRLIRESHLIGDPHFKTSYPVEYRLPGGGMGTFEFTYAYGNGSPIALYQRLALPTARKPLDKEIHASAWKFSRVIEAGIVPADRSGVLVLSTPEQRRSPEVQEAFEIIGSVTRVLDLADFDTVRAEFARLPMLLDH